MRNWMSVAAMMRARVGGLACFLFAAPSLVGCDAGKAPYNDGVELEEKGQLAEAADKYDGVCRKAPDSKMCAPSVTRAAEVRIKLADQDIKAFKFAEAKALLAKVAEGGDEAGKKKAHDLSLSADLNWGLRWEKAMAQPEKRNALDEMEAVAASGASTARKAADWLTKERAALLLASATGACTPNVTDSCGSICERLVKLHPDSSQATKAKEYLVAVEAARAAAAAKEEERLYGLLVEAEKLLAQQQGAWRATKAHGQCVLQQLAVNPDNAIAAVVACGEDPNGDYKADKREKAWKALMEQIANEAVTGALGERWKRADEQGEYERQTPKKPASMTTGKK